ncbi:MAG: hypothetical protein LWX54_09400 [Deltaproteobacteria bacterium]|jgi:hypothetical protein|nr:hypothetical protein [Deltaproteobacteria bacterium]
MQPVTNPASPVLRVCTKPGGWGIKIKIGCGHKNRLQPIRNREGNGHVLNSNCKCLNDVGLMKTFSSSNRRFVFIKTAPILQHDPAWRGGCDLIT